MPDHGTKSYEGKDDIIDAIQTGILSRKVVRYRYADARARSRQGFVAPYAMALYRHGLYVIGARLDAAEDDPSEAKLGVFAIERFTEAEHLRSKSFTVPTTLRLRDLLNGAFGLHVGDPSSTHEVVIEFNKEKAVLVASRTWHPNQRIERRSDGRIRLSFECSELAPVVSWVLEWGPHARAVAPPPLVQRVKDELEEARKQY